MPKQNEPPQTILAVFAHPDDEAFSTGGALSCYAASGIKVVLVCATRGEVGEIADPSLATPDTLGQVREAELRCAGETMGISELIFLDYRDSGMAGTPENNDPRAFINAPKEDVVRTMVEIIRRVQPDIVVTFEPNGGYGHPDHIAIHNHTVAAFRAAANSAEHPKAGPIWKAKRLFYTVIPRSFFIELRSLLVAIGENTHDLDQFEESETLWSEERIDVTIDVSGTVQSKWDALNCHRTQFGPGNLFRRIPEEQAMQLMSYEYFTLAWPEPVTFKQMGDLFEGL